MFQTLYRCCSGNSSHVLPIFGRNVAVVRRSFVLTLSCQRVCYNVDGGLCACRKFCTNSWRSPADDIQTQSTRRRKLPVDGPSLKDFVENETVAVSQSNDVADDEPVPYINKADISGNNRRG